MSFSISSKTSSSSSSFSKVDSDKDVDKKDKADKKEDKKWEVEERVNVYEDKDSFQQQQQRAQQPRRNTVAAAPQAEQFWANSAQQTDQAIQKEAKDIWKNELGREISDDEAARLCEQAKESGCINEREARTYFQKMVSGSPEKNALNHVGAEFERNLGRSITVAEQQQWLKDSGLNMNSSTFARDVTARIQSSEEFRILHPEAARPAPGGAQAPIIDQLFPQGWEQFAKYDSKMERNIMDNGKANCGPTSAAMVARALGYGEGKTDAQLIKEFMRVGGTTGSGTTPGGVADMVRQMGSEATVKLTPTDLSALDAALAEGKMVIANGDYNVTGVDGRNGAAMSGHFCLVTGKDEQGNYLINDPWNGEKVKFSPEAMLNYFQEHRVSDNSRRGAMIIVETPVAAQAEAPAPAAPAAPTAPAASPAPTGNYEQAVAAAIANAPRDTASMRQYWADFAADTVAPRLEALGVPREKIKDAILWGLSEGTTTVGNRNDGRYFMENGERSNPIVYSNLGANAGINTTTQTPDGLKANGDPFKYWQVGLAGVQVKDAVKGGWLKNAFEQLYPGQTPQQVGQRMLEMMGETDGEPFPNLSIDELVKMDGEKMVNGKWAAILLRDPAINVMAMTQHPNLEYWIDENRKRLGENFFTSIQQIANQAFA
ncbi:MAG TPA: C39 family peptidase [Myxococcaceae bacterium]|jgi:hypothetical protein